MDPLTCPGSNTGRQTALILFEVAERRCSYFTWDHLSCRRTLGVLSSSKSPYMYEYVCASHAELFTHHGEHTQGYYYAFTVISRAVSLFQVELDQFKSHEPSKERSFLASLPAITSGQFHYLPNTKWLLCWAAMVLPRGIHVAFASGTQRLVKLLV